MKRLELAAKYLKNNRLKEYEIILRLLIGKKVQLMSLRDYVRNDYDKDRSFWILRHDVDYSSPGTREMFNIEKSLNVKSSFYFRKSTYDFALMKEIEDFGSEASLHFETITDFAKENKIYNSKDFDKSNWENECFKILSNDIKTLREKGFVCETIAGHGDPVGEMIGQANYFLTYKPKAYEKLGIKLEAYNEEFIQSLDYYLSDNAIEVNNGYQYGLDAFEVIDKNHKKVVFLTHPNHWKYDLKGKIKKIIKILLKGSQKIESVFDLY